MARFVQRISEEEVRTARAKIRAGATLRSAAAEIPCAPSTLSVRIRKAEAAEAAARERVPLGEQELLAAGRPEYILELKRIALGTDTSDRDRLSAIKELLKLEPAASEKGGEYGSVWHVYGDTIVPDEVLQALRAARGEEDSQT
jgi:hypothetical protein